jgi:membrane-anchored protein YejM (alkaline phosphatase superfamily)
MKIIQNNQFKQQLYLFMCFAFIFQCLLFFITLADSFHSFANLISNNTSILMILCSVWFKATFIFVYLFYWLICTYLISVPGILLSNWPRIASVLTIIFLFIFIVYSEIDFFILNHYQFHLGSDILSWFVDKKYPLFVNLQIFHDMGLSFQEFSYVLVVLCAILLILIGLMLCSAYLVKRYNFQQYLIYFNIYLAGFIFGFFFYFKYCYQNNFYWQIAQLKHYPALGWFSQFMVKTKIWHQSKIAPEVIDIHSLQEEINMPKIEVVNIKNKPNILWIVVDTLRADMVVPQYMPFLSDYQKQNIHFINHWSSGNSTQPGLFSMFYSLPANYFSSALIHQTSPLMIQSLLANGYQLNVFNSNVSFKNPPFDKSVFVDFSESNRHLSNYDKGIDPDEDLNHQLKQFLLSNHKQPFFTFILYSDVHDYCAAQNFKSLYQKPLAECQRWNMTTNRQVSDYKLRYLNAVHHVDGLLNQVINTLKKAKLEENTIVVITADHGESFNDHHNNHLGHTNSFSATELHVPMIIHWPGKEAQTFEHFTSHYDLAPTFLKELGLYNDSSKTYMVGDSLFVPHQDSRELMIVGSYFYMGAIKQDKYYIFSPDGEILTYDMDEKLLLSDKISLKDLTASMHKMTQYYKKRIVQK